jgi:FkbM family methyltransferase
MAKIVAIWRMITVTRNPFAVLSLKMSKIRRSVTFRNKSTYCLTYPQFRVFRDNFAYLTKYNVTQLNDDTFRIVDTRSEVTSSYAILPMIFDLMTEFALHRENGLYHLKNNEMELFGSLSILYCIQEIRRGDYACDCKGKVVLDVGGFEGESAVYFWSKGAKKVIIYEPVLVHLELINKNVKLNHIEAEIHNSGIGEKDGTKIIQYSEKDSGFGLLDEGPNRLEIKITEVSKVIEESGAEIAKFDCEGAEECLVNVPVEILQKVDYYMIEVHSPSIRRNILGKFEQAGFKLERERTISGQYSILALRRTV